MLTIEEIDSVIESVECNLFDPITQRVARAIIFTMEKRISKLYYTIGTLEFENLMWSFNMKLKEE